MCWAYKPGSFTYAIFIVYYSTVLNTKNYIVINLYPLNYVTVFNNYLLPFSTNVI